jgi:hypothetical protein
LYIMANKERITITIDPDVLRRLDKVSDTRGEPRAAMIERILRNNIDGEESMMRDMENPVWRSLISTLLASESVVKAIATIAGENMPPERIREVQAGIKVQAERGRQRQAAKRGKSSAKVSTEGA